MKYQKLITAGLILTLMMSSLSGCGKKEIADNDADRIVTESELNTRSVSVEPKKAAENVSTVSAAPVTPAITEAPIEQTITPEQISLTDDLPYADHSEIHSGTATLYKNTKANSKGITVCVNAGHGTQGGSSVQTLCHPDGTPKVTGGSTSAGSTYATAVSGGTTFNDGTPEAQVTLETALILKDLLLDEGYSVLMIRESEDVQLDNVARTVLANKYADCHIALHWDSTESDKGAFYIKVPSVESYKSMEPVASTWEKSDALGEDLIQGLRDAGRQIYSGGSMEIDLTQISYSSIPSVDIELGDRASDHSEAALTSIAQGLLGGVNLYFDKQGQSAAAQDLSAQDTDAQDTDAQDAGAQQ